MAYTIRQKPASTSNYTKGRAGRKINKIVIHHAATTDFDGIARTFQNPAKKVSAHYGVGRNNDVDQYVQEADMAWHSGNREANYTSIGIENVNSSGAPDWNVANETVDTLVQLVRDIAIRNNLLPLDVGRNLFQHKDFKKTFCAGVLGGRLQEVADRVNAPEQNVPVNPPVAPQPVKPATDAFLGSRGYLRRGDSGSNIEAMNKWLRAAFPAYAPAGVLGSFFGPITERTVKEFQRRAKADGKYSDVIDGNVGPITLRAMRSYGFNR